MRNLVLALACAAMSFGLVQGQDEDYQMYELIHLAPMSGHAQNFQAALKTHNETYHQEGAERVNTWSIMSGPRAGTVIWAKGPLNWTDLDSPIEGDAHMDDWWSNVLTHGEMKSIEFWRGWEGLAYMPEDFNPRVLVLRYFDIHEQKRNNVEHVLKSIIALHEDKNWETGLRVFWNAAPADGSPEMAMVWYHENYASMDVDRNFFDAYKEAYHVDRREYFENWNEMTDFKGLEIWNLMPELSVLGSDE